MIAGVMWNPAGSRLAWNFVQANWAAIEKQLGGFNNGEIVASTSTFCDADMHNQVKDFFAAHKIPAAERTLRQALERVNYCADLKSQQSPQLASWLARHGSAAGK